MIVLNNQYSKISEQNIDVHISKSLVGRGKTPPVQVADNQRLPTTIMEITKYNLQFTDK